MRKVVSVLLSAAMVLSLCAGCSSSSSNTADTKVAEEKGAGRGRHRSRRGSRGREPAVLKRI